MLAPAPQASCRECGNPFWQRTTMHALCSPRCAVKELAAKKKAERAERVQTRAQIDAMRPRSYWQKKAQAAFNMFVRARDRKAGYGCICCGEPLDWNSGIPGGAVDAGHFMSRGSSPELAFDERNVNAQRKGCNRPGGATRDKFRAGMVARWGEAVVQELEGPHPPAKWTGAELRELQKVYAAKARALA